MVGEDRTPLPATPRRMPCRRTARLSAQKSWFLTDEIRALGTTALATGAAAVGPSPAQAIVLRQLHQASPIRRRSGAGRPPARRRPPPSPLQTAAGISASPPSW